jgi:hypothetical protein
MLEVGNCKVEKVESRNAALCRPLPIHETGQPVVLEQTILR